MDKKIYLLVFIFQVILPSVILGQSIKGRVIDKQTLDGIPNCSIHILNKPIGVISNEQGNFVLYGVSDDDTLVISSLGYQPWQGTVKEILSECKHSFSLKEKSMVLQPLIVNYYPPKELLKICLKKSHDALIKHAILNTYYREYLKFNDTIKKFSDGMVDFYINGSPKDIDIRVKASRSANELAPAASESEKKFYDAVRMNFITKNYFPYEITEAFNSQKFDNYSYKYIKSEYSDRYYVIEIIREKDSSHAKVFISKSDTLLKEVKFVFQPNKRFKSLVNTLKIKRAIRTIVFRKFHNRLFLTHVRSDVVAYNHSKLFNWDWLEEAVTEVMVNNIKTKNIQALPSKLKYRKKFLYENGTHFTTPFWKTENIIIGSPEEKAFMSKIKDSSYSSAQ